MSQFALQSPCMRQVLGIQLLPNSCLSADQHLWRFSRCCCRSSGNSRDSGPWEILVTRAVPRGTPPLREEAPQARDPDQRQREFDLRAGPSCRNCHERDDWLPSPPWYYSAATASGCTMPARRRGSRLVRPSHGPQAYFPPKLPRLGGKDPSRGGVRHGLHQVDSWYLTNEKASNVYYIKAINVLLLYYCNGCNYITAMESEHSSI